VDTNKAYQTLHEHALLKDHSDPTRDTYRCRCGVGFGPDWLAKPSAEEWDLHLAQAINNAGDETSTIDTNAAYRVLSEHRQRKENQCSCGQKYGYLDGSHELHVAAQLQRLGK